MPKKIDRHPDVHKFIQAMTSRDFGTFLVAGKTGSGRTTLIREYLRFLPKGVRSVVLTDNPEEYTAGEVGASCTVHVHDNTYPLSRLLELRPSVIVMDQQSLSTPADLEILERLVMSSVATNVVISLNAPSMGHPIHSFTNLVVKNGLLTPAAAYKVFKGLAYLERDEDSNVHTVQCMNTYPSLQLHFESRQIAQPNRQHEYRAMSENQGWPSATEQKTHLHELSDPETLISEFLHPMLKEAFGHGADEVFLSAKYGTLVRMGIDTREISNNVINPENFGPLADVLMKEPTTIAWGVSTAPLWVMGAGNILITRSEHDLYPMLSFRVLRDQPRRKAS